MKNVHVVVIVAIISMTVLLGMAMYLDNDNKMQINQLKSNNQTRCEEQIK